MDKLNKVVDFSIIIIDNDNRKGDKCEYRHYCFTGNRLGTDTSSCIADCHFQLIACRSGAVRLVQKKKSDCRSVCLACRYFVDPIIRADFVFGYRKERDSK